MKQLEDIINVEDAASHSSTYPQYQASGKVWLGKIPAHWQCTRLKFTAIITMGQSPNSKDYNWDEMGLPFLQGNADFGAQHPKPKVYCPMALKHAQPGDLLLSIRAPVGDLNVADRSYGIGRGLCAITPRLASLSQAYAWYLLQVTRVELDALATGSTYDAVSIDEVRNMTCLLPPLNEQRAITKFLDQEIAKLNELTRALERVLTVIEERRAALIYHAVTKGLEPKVLLKASGVQWLGKIPAHWQCTRLKFAATITMGQSPDSEDYNRDRVAPPFLQGNAEFGNCYPSPDVYCPTANRRASPGDFLLSVRAPVGALNIADQQYGIGRGLCAITARPALLNPRYAWYLLQVTRAELYALATGSTYDAVSIDEVRNMTCLLPPLGEQQAIAAYLERQIAKLDTLRAKVHATLVQLADYYEALLWSVVTGKVQVS